MSSDFYFHLWFKTLRRLEKLTNLDVHYQTTKYHDQKRCDAAQRLVGLLAEYQAVYNELVECDRGNLQVQKIGYIGSLVQAVVARITELNQQIRKLDASQHQFFGHGLVSHRITTNDTELNEMPRVLQRPETVERMITEALEYAHMKREEKLRLEEDNEQAPEEQEVDKWWETDADETNTANEMFNNVYQVEEKLDEETLKRRQLVALIQAHEKSRQVTKWCTQRHERRILWTKELTGERNPESRLEMKERSARLIQKICRKYMELKRKKITDQKRDEILGLNFNKPANEAPKRNNEEIQIKRAIIRKKYQDEWKTLLENMKQKYLNKKGVEIAEDFRDGIREWFMTWYSQVRTFYEIPNDKNGGSAQILKEEVPSPLEWWDEYQTHLQQVQSMKNKSSMQQKWERQQTKKHLKGDNKAENKKNIEEAMQNKLMKNPKSHPGFHFPESKQTNHIIREIIKYRKKWQLFDRTEAKDVKEKYIEKLVNEDAWFEVKTHMRQEVDSDMRQELKILKKTLKRDYQNIGQKVPEMIIKKKKIKAKKLKAKASKPNEETIKELAVKEILKIVPKTKITDFIGDHNFAGDDFRCMYIAAKPFAGETRYLWWDKCRDVALGCRPVLLVGPAGCGKTTLVHAMASANGAYLLELDPATFADEFLSSVYLERLMKSVVSCAKATQPCVIYIRHIQRLFYRKVPPQEKENNLEMIRKYLLRYIFKGISKKDNVAIIGSCEDPWLTKSKLMLKMHPNVVLVPSTNYTTVVLILKNWILNNHSLPRDLDIQSLAFMLQGYKFSFLKDTLQLFLSAENIVKIAAHGLTIQEVYNHILEFDEEKPIDYSKYLKWYSARTAWGRREAKQLETQLQFKDLADQMDAKKKPRRRTSRSSRSSKRASRSSRKSKL